MSQRTRKRIEEPFEWMKTVGGGRKVLRVVIVSPPDGDRPPGTAASRPFTVP